MISRVAAFLLSVATVALSGAAVARSDSPPVGPSFYVVRADPRLCPSPLCGGYWVALANHARTTCHDGALRPQCYVVATVGKGRHRPAVDVPAGALARAVIESSRFEGFGDLGVLVAEDVFEPAGRAPTSGRFVRLVDTGIRCVRAPCFSFRAARLNQSVRTPISDIDLGSADAAPDEVARAESALRKTTGLLAQGRVVSMPDGGRAFRSTRLFLRSGR